MTDLLAHDRHLLPRHSSPPEKALAGLNHAAFGLPFPIATLWNPWTIRADLLAHLAHALRVDFWRESWPEARKRSVCANAFALKRMKGTLAGIGRHIELADGKLLRAVLPPQRVFSGASLTRAQREAWLDRLPQIRVHLAREKATAGFKVFTGGRTYRSFCDGRFFMPSTAGQRLQLRSVWVEGGLATPARVEQFQGFYRIYRPGHAGRRVFVGLPVGRRFFQPSSAWQRIITIAPATNQPWRQPVGPKLEPVSAEPELVVVSRSKGRRAFVGDTMRGHFLCPHRSLSYHRFAFYDGTRVPMRARPVQFMSVGRYGWPARVAQLEVSAPGRRPEWAAGGGIIVPKARFWRPHDGRPTQDVMRAIRVSKRAADRVLLKHAARPRLLAGQIFRAGADSFVIGRPNS
jgi:hypothetical protein